MAWSWYTKGRRIPTLIGKDVSGRRIPGGPYTGLQAVTAAAVPALLWSTRGWWAAEMAGLALVAVLVGVTVAAVKLVGKVDFASRNPLLLLAGYARQTSRPTAGTLAGHKVTEPKPHRVACTVDVTHGSVDNLPGAAMPVLKPSPLMPSDPPVAEGKGTDGPAVEVGVAAVEARRARTSVEVSLQPATPLAPDRRRTGLEAFLAAAATPATSPEEDAA